jgi:hypothetical protein
MRVVSSDDAFLESLLDASSGNNEEEGDSAVNGMESISITSSTSSKVKWKKKRFLMMQDVRNCIQQQNNNYNHRKNQDDETRNLAVQRAEEMMRRWWNVYDRSGSDVTFRPTWEAYNLWLTAIAKSGEPNCGKQAERVLKEELIPKLATTTSGNTLVTNNNNIVVSYSIVMDAYARQSKHQRQPDERAAIAAERILFELIELVEQQLPNSSNVTVTSVVCDTVINAWAQLGTWKAAERAEEIYRRMQLLGRSSRHVLLQPTQHTVATVIHGWAMCNGGGPAALRAQQILDQMLKQSLDPSLEVDVQPDTVIFNSCIHAWASSRDPQAGTKAAGLLKQMQDLHETKRYDCLPDTITYNSVLSAWSHSGHVNAAPRAEQILQEMIQAHRKYPQTAPAPCTISYNNVLNAWSKSKLDGAPGRAEKILKFMIQNDDIQPDVYSFTSVLDALAKSKEPDKATRARALLDQLLDLYDSTKSESLKPSQVPFNAVLNAAAFSAHGTTDDQRREALQVAVQTFSLMRLRQVAPDSISYGNLLKAFHNLVPAGPTRTNMAANVFEKCCQEGYVSDLVWNEIRKVIPSKQLATFVDKHQFRSKNRNIALMDVQELPKPWRRNVPPSKKKSANSTRVQEQPEVKRSAPVLKRRTITEGSYQSGRDI